MTRQIGTLASCLAAVVLFGSCLGDPTGPGAGVGALAVAPRFASVMASSHLGITTVRLRLRRVEAIGAVLDTVIPFGASDSVAVTLRVRLEGRSADFLLTLAMSNALGDTIFRSDPLTVRVSSSASVSVATPVLNYVGVGANAAGVRFVNPPLALIFGQTSALVAEAFDGQGTAIPGTPIEFDLVNRADTVRATIPNPAVGSIVARSIRGSVLVRARLFTPHSVQQAIVIQPVAANVIAQGGGSQTGTVGQALAQPLVARVRAADGLGVQGVPVTFEVLTGGGSLNRLVDTTDVNGDARSTLTVGTVPGPQSARAVVPSLGGATAAFSATAVVGAVSSLVFGVQPTNALSGAVIAPAVTVRARDALGNDVTGFTGNVTLALLNNPSAAVLGGTLTRAAVAGVATFSDLAIVGLGTGITMRATSGALTAATSAAFNVSIGAPVALAFTVQPPATSSGTPFNVAVAARDAAGNTVPTYTGTITVAIGTNPAGGTLSGGASVAAVAGVATFAGLAIDNVGNGYTLTANATGLTAGSSNPFNVGVPAGVNAWINATGGNWSTPANWSLGTVPTATDTVWIRQAGTYTVTVDAPATVGRMLVGGASGTQTLAITTQTLTLTDSALVSANGAVAVSGGAISGTGAMAVANSFTWSGGSLQGGARVRVLAGGTLTISGGTARSINNFTLEVAGTGTWTGTAMINSGSAGTLRVLPTGTLAIQGDPQWVYNMGGAVSVFDVQGALTRTTSTGTAIVIGVSLSGTSNVTSGTLEMRSAGASSGTFSTGAAGTLRFGAGTFTLAAGSMVQGAGLVEFDAGAAVTNAGNWSMAGTTRIAGGTFTHNGTGSTGTLDFSSGTRNGSGRLDVTGAMTWSAGDLFGGGGETRVLAGGSLAVSGTTTRTLNAQTLAVAGTGTWTGTAMINSGSAGTLRVLPTGTLAIQGDPQWVYNMGGAVSVFDVQGALTRTTSTGTAVVIGVSLSGTSNVTSGTLEMRSAGASSGTFSTGAAGTLRFGAGTFTLAAGSMVQGAGLVEFVTGAAVASAGNWSVTGTTRLLGGTFTYDGNGSTGTFDLAGGTRAGSGTFDATTAMTWTSGDLFGGNGSVRIPVGATLSISGTATRTLNNQTLEISGSAIWTGTHSVNSGSAATLLVNPGGTLNIQGDPSFLYNMGGATSQLLVNGTLTRTVSAGSVIINAPFNHFGSTTVSTGVLDLRNGGTLGGGIAATPVGGLRLTSGTYGMQPAFAATGAGTVLLDGASLDGLITGDTATFTNLTLQAGAVNTGTGGVMRVNGALAWTGAASLGNGAVGGITRVAPSGTLTMTGTAARTLNNHLLQNEGTATWSGTFNLNSGSGARIRNAAGASFTWSGDGSYLYNLGGALSVFENLGAFVRSGTGIAVLGAQLIDTLGTSFNLQAGELRLGNGARLGGAKTLSGGVLENSAGVLSLRLGATWTGPTGYIRVAGGSMSIDSSGTAMTMPRLDLTGGQLAHEGLLAISGTMNWTAGDITSNTVGLGGTTRINVGATLTVGGTAARNFNGTHRLELLGNTTVTATGNINSGSGAVIENSAIFDLQGSASLLYNLGGTTPIFRNFAAGTLRSSGATTGTMGYAIQNTGALSVTGDTLRLSGGSTTAFAGTAAVATSALALTGGTFTQSGAFTTTGVAGNLVVGGILNLNGFTTTVAGSFSTVGTGVFQSAITTSALNVTRNVSIAGGASTVTAGQLQVGGSFTQGGATNAFVASGTHRTVINGTPAVAQNITFIGAPTSRFNRLDIVDITRTIVIQSNVFVADTLLMRGGSGSSNLVGASNTQRLTANGALVLIWSTLSPRLAPPVLEINSLPAVGAIGPGGGLTPDTAVFISGNITALPTGAGYNYNSIRVGAVASFSFTTDTIAGDLHVPANLAFFAGSSTFRIGGKLRVTGAAQLGIVSTDVNLTVVDSTIFSGGSTNGFLTAGSLTALGAFVQSGGDPAAFSATGTFRVHLNGGGLQQVRFVNPGNTTTTSHFADLQIGNSSVAGIQFLSPVFAGGLLYSLPGRPAISRISGTAADSLSINGILADSITFDGVPLRIGGTGLLTNLSVFRFQNMNPAVNQFTITRGSGTFFPNDVTFATTPNAGVYNLVVTNTAAAGPFSATFFNSSPTATLMQTPQRRYLRAGAPLASVVWNSVTLPP